MKLKWVEEVHSQGTLKQVNSYKQARVLSHQTRPHLLSGGYCKHEVKKKMGWSDFRDIFVNTIPSTSSTLLYNVFIILNKIWKNNPETAM